MKVSCSGTHKWLNCSLSPHLEQNAIELNENNSFANIGTAIHEYCEKNLKSAIEGVFNTDNNNSFYPSIAQEVFDVYKLYIEDLSENFTHKIKLEYKVNLNNYIEGLTGKVDCIVIKEFKDNIDIHVIDLKTGRNFITAKQNPQLLCYLLGVYEEYKNKGKLIKFFGHIIQPIIRKNSVFEVSEEFLLNFGQFLKDRYQDVIENPIASPGKHCKDHYCKGRFLCKPYKEYLDNSFKQLEVKKENELTEEEMRILLDKGSEYAKWITGAISTIKKGMVESKINLPGYQVKVVKKRTYIEDKAKLIQKFIALDIPEEVYMTYNITPISKLEKHLTNKQLEELVDVIKEEEHSIKVKKVINKEN